MLSFLSDGATTVTAHIISGKGSGQWVGRRNNVITAGPNYPQNIYDLWLQPTALNPQKSEKIFSL